MRRLALGLSVLATLAACGGGGDDSPALDGGLDAAVDAPEPDLTGPLFEPAHLVEVAITMAPADWDALRVQTRSLQELIEGDCLAQPFPSPFTNFAASVTIDGTRLDQVAVHKKGFLGSLNADKPSLKLDLDDYVPGQRYLGLEKLTLNNANQDPAYVRQCLTYGAFTRAGLVAPRCNFARVRVNGADLGVYVHVESVDRRFTRRHFANPDGELYEGTLSDFRPGWVDTFDPKGPGDRRDLQPLVDALQLPDDAAMDAALATTLDRAQFESYWAMEVITGQWDGYANNKNNYFVFHDLGTDKHVFFPWGVDGTFQPGHAFGDPQTGPNAVAAAGLLAYRLYASSTGRARFLARQRALLATAWNEVELRTELDRMVALIGPIADATDPGWRAALADVRAFIDGRRALLTAELDAGPTWTEPLGGYPCLDVRGAVDASFTTTYGTIGAANPLTTGAGTLTLTLAGGPPVVMSPVGATAGRDPNPQPGQPASELVQVFGIRPGDGHVIALVVAWPQPWFGPFALDVGFFGVFGLAFDYDPATDTATEIGFLFGRVTLTQAQAVTGAPVVGTLHANADQPGTQMRLPVAARRLDRAALAGQVRAEARALTRRGK